jgi:hypothetical protein
VTGLPCAWHASTKPSSDAKLMLNAPRIFEYFRTPIPLAWPVGVMLSRVRNASQAGLSEQQRSPADGWHDKQVIAPFCEWKHNGRPAGNGWNRSTNNARFGSRAAA